MASMLQGWSPHSSPHASPQRRAGSASASTAASSPHHHRAELDALSRRAARVSERAAMVAVDGLPPTSPHRALQQCRANHVRLGVRRMEGALRHEADLLDACSSGVRELVRSCGGREAAEALAAEAAAHGGRSEALEEEAAALRTRCAELEAELEVETHQRAAATQALESHAAQMVEQVEQTHASHAEQLEHHRSEHEAELLARQQGWAQAAGEHGDELAELREQWHLTAQRHADEVKQLQAEVTQLRGARDTALAHAKDAEEQRAAQAAELAHQTEAVSKKWSALERTTDSVHVALQAVDQAEAAQAQAEAEKTAIEVQLRAEREARQRAESRSDSATAAAAAAEAELQTERTAATNRARRLQVSANSLAIQLAGVRKVQATLRQQAQLLQVAVATCAEPMAAAVADHFSITAGGVAAATHAARDAQAAEAEKEQLETMRLLIDAARAEATDAARRQQEPEQQQEAEDAEDRRLSREVR
jgi:hypothetical protein